MDRAADHSSAKWLKIWRREWDSIPPSAASHSGTLPFRDNTLCLCGLQANLVSGWSFYSFSCEPHFRRKWYQWYQWGKSHNGHNERNGDLDEAAGAADACGCS